MTLRKTPRRTLHKTPLTLLLAALVAALAAPTVGCGSTSTSKKDDKEAEDDDGKRKKKDDEDDRDEQEPALNAPSKGNAMGIAEDGDFIADSGFRPSKHGLVFPNGDRDESGRRQVYPDSSKGFLDVDGIQRLFGSDNVCLGDKDSCVLTPGAREFMHMANKVMNRGQCEGMAVFSLSMFNGLDDPGYFKEGAEFASDLKRDDTRAAVGYYFSFQFLQPMRNDLFGRMRQLTPNKVLDQVITALNSKEDMVALEFIQPGRGGHAVVPYAVEDAGNDKFRIRIWDNNFPKVSRFIEIDKKENTWKYSFAAINPNEDPSPWGGKAFPNTIVATPVSLRMRDMVCPFCKKDEGTKMFMVAGNSVNATITDEQGRKLGWQNGKVVNEIPGAKIHPTLAYVPGEGTPEAMYEVPADHEYDVALDSEAGDDDVSVGVFGQGAAVVVENIKVDKKQTDHVSFGKDSLGVGYKPSRDKAAPRVRMAVGSGADSYQVKLEGAKAHKGKKLSWAINRKTMQVDVKEDKKAIKGMRMRIARFNNKGEQSVAEKKGAHVNLRGLRGRIVKDDKQYTRRRLTPAKKGVKRRGLSIKKRPTEVKKNGGPTKPAPKGISSKKGITPKKTTPKKTVPKKRGISIKKK